MQKSVSQTSNGLSMLNAPLTLHHAALVKLREAIVTGNLKPGSLLREAEVASWLGLSVTPIREALFQLASEGLVEIQPNRLKRVAPIDHQAIVELLQVQNEIWVLGYEWGGKNIGPTELKRLAKANEAASAAIAHDDVLGFVIAANNFNLVLMEASKNKELLRISVDRLPLMQRYFVLCLSDVLLGSSRMTGSLSDIYKELSKGNVKKATACFRKVCEHSLILAKEMRDASAASSSSMPAETSTMPAVA